MDRRFAMLCLLSTPCGMLSWGHSAFASEDPTDRAPQSAPSMYIERVDPELNGVLAQDVIVARVATGFNFTEGPMWYQDRLWFADCRADKLYTMTARGKVTTVMQNAGGVFNPDPNNQGSNAMEIARDGSIVLTQMGNGSIQDLDPFTLRLTPFITAYHGKRLNSPNDIVYAPDGSLWFTDPPFGLIGGDKSPDKALPWNAVFRYEKGTLTPVITDIPLPNGIGFSPDGKTLYISNYGPEMYVRAYDVGIAGVLSNPRDFIRYPGPQVREAPDGLKVDSEGNLWTTGPGGIRIISPAGKVLGQIKLPEIASNIAFGGTDRRTVYITASHSVYRLHSEVPGQMLLYYR